MTLFTSPRERIYWTVAILAQLIIYSTLGIQPFIANIIRSAGLLEPLFIFGFGLLTLAIILLGVLEKLHWKMIALAIGLLAILSFATSRLGMAEERTHLFEYAFIGSIIYLARNERKKRIPSTWSPVISAIFIVSLAGIGDELIQYYLPNRVADIRDVFFNIAAGTVAVLEIYLIQSFIKKRLIRSAPKS